MNKILLVLKLPPPVTGATIMNQYVADSKVLSNSFNCKILNTNYVTELDKMGYASPRKLFLFFKYLLKLLYSLILFSPSLVYFQMSPIGYAFIRDALYLIIIKLLNKEILIHLHGKGINLNAERNWLINRLYKFVFHDSQVICLSNSLKSDITRVYNGKPFIINNAIKNTSLNIAKKVRDDSIRVLFLSNLIISKGILDFIEAVEILQLKRLNFIATIAGEDRDLSQDDINRIIFKKKLANHLVLLGPQYGFDKEKLFLESDIFAFPTYYENETWGVVNLEAMQAGLPVISTYEGAIPEIVDDGVTGFLVEKQNPQALADKIEILIKDKELRVKMGQAGRKKFLEKYTLDIFERNMKNVFDQVLQDIN